MSHKNQLRGLGLALAVFLLVAQCGPVALAASLPPEGDAPPSSSQAAAAEAPPDSAPPESPPPELAAADPSSLAPLPQAEGEQVTEEAAEAEDEAEDEAEEEALQDGMTFALQSTIVDAATIIVYTFDELVSALTQDNGYTTVYIGADITGKSGGAAIHTHKHSVVIDGCPPGSPEGTRYTYTDYDSAATNDTIRVANTGVKAVTVQNLNVVARNYYGLVSCQNSSTVTPTVTYSNIAYSGPQAIYNRYGTSVVLNSTFTITQTGTAASQEFAEVNRLELGGTVTINAASTSDAVLWMTNTAPALVVRGGANVSITTPSYFIYSDNNAAVSLESGASLSVATGTHGFTYNTMALASLSLATGASLGMTQNAATANGALRVDKSLTLADGALLDVQGKGTGAGIQFTSAGAAATFTNPARVRVLTASGAGFGFATGAASSLSITAGVLNLWSTATAFAPGSPPTAMWNKAGTAPLTVQASYTGGTLSQLSSNLVAGDPVAQTLTAQNFGVRTSQLVAFGACPLTIDEVTDRSLTVTGSAGGAAQLSAVYASAQGPQTATATADGSGAYSLPLAGGTPLADGTVTVTAAWNGLYGAQMATVASSPGALELAAVPAALNFGSATISAVDTLVRRQTSNFAVSVSDTRPVKSPWSLQVGITGPLQATINETQLSLPNALVFVGADAGAIPLGATPLTVHTQPQDQLAETVTVSWAENEGILLLLPAGQGRAGASYATTLGWYLVDAP